MRVCVIAMPVVPCCNFLGLQALAVPSILLCPLPEACSHQETAWYLLPDTDIVVFFAKFKHEAKQVLAGIIWCPGILVVMMISSPELACHFCFSPLSVYSCNSLPLAEEQMQLDFFCTCLCLQHRAAACLLHAVGDCCMQPVTDLNCQHRPGGRRSAPVSQSVFPKTGC